MGEKLYYTGSSETFGSGDKVVHGHRFKRLTTTKLRYVPVGDLAKGVYLVEIEVYDGKDK